MIFSTPTTPTRERLTRVEGASACASRAGAGIVSVGLAMGSSMPTRISGRELPQNWSVFGPCPPYTPERLWLDSRIRGGRRVQPGLPGGRRRSLASIRTAAVAADEQPFGENEE